MGKYADEITFVEDVIKAGDLERLQLLIEAGLQLPIRRMITGGAPIGPDQVRVFVQAAP